MHPHFLTYASHNLHKANPGPPDMVEPICCRVHVLTRVAFFFQAVNEALSVSFCSTVVKYNASSSGLAKSAALMYASVVGA